MWIMEHEFDDEPSYLFLKETRDNDPDNYEPEITIAPGNYALAKDILNFLRLAYEPITNLEE